MKTGDSVTSAKKCLAFSSDKDTCDRMRFSDETGMKIVRNNLNDGQ